MELGAAGREEVFRWESQIATNRKDVIDAGASASVERGKLLPRYQDFDRTCLPRRSRDQASPIERQDHLVNRRRRDFEVPLDVGLRRRPADHFRVRRNERKVLPLELGERSFHKIVRFSCFPILPPFSRLTLKLAARGRSAVRTKNRVQPPTFVSTLVENTALTSHDNRLAVPIFRRTRLHYGLPGAGDNRQPQLEPERTTDDVFLSGDQITKRQSKWRSPKNILTKCLSRAILQIGEQKAKCHESWETTLK